MYKHVFFNTEEEKGTAVFWVIISERLIYKGNMTEHQTCFANAQNNPIKCAVFANVTD